MDFPARPPTECTVHPDLIGALGATPQRVLAARDYLVIYGSEADVRALRPNMERLAQGDRFAVIVTAPGTDGVDTMGLPRARGANAEVRDRGLSRKGDLLC